MPTPFDGLTMQRALKKIPTLTEGQGLNETFVVRKDHWQSGLGYIGPSPQPSETGYQEFMVELARIFIGIDAMVEVLTNRRDGVVGKEPNWFWTPRRGLAKGEKPTEAEQKLIDEANALSTTWWNERKLHQILRSIVFTMLWAERAGFRIYVPSGLRMQDIKRDEETGQEIPTGDPYIEAADFEEALSYIYVDHPSPRVFAVAEDPDTKERVGILRFEKNGRVYAELTYADRDTGETILRILGSAEDDSETFKMGGRLTMHEVYHDEFLTAQIRQLQRALNFAATLVPHNMATSAFVERTLINAQMPGDWEYDEAGQKIPGSFQPKPYHIGASTMNFVRGIEVESEDNEGNKEVKLTTPSIDRRDPAPISPVIEGKDDIRRELFRLADQEHLASKSDAEASGLAYEQKRASYITSLNETAAPTMEVCRMLVETSMAMAEDIRDEPGKYTETLRVECQLRLDKGPISADEQRANWEAVESNKLPLTEALSRNGVGDPDAAIIEINSQPLSILQREQRIAEVVAAWTTAGTSLEGALKRIKRLFPDMTDEEIKELLGGAGEDETGVQDPIVDPTGEGDDLDGEDEDDVAE